MELTREHLRSIIFATFDLDYPDKSALMNTNVCLAIKQHPIAL